MVRPCVARELVKLVVDGLASMYPAFDVEFDRLLAIMENSAPASSLADRPQRAISPPQHPVLSGIIPHVIDQCVRNIFDKRHNFRDIACHRSSSLGCVHAHTLRRQRTRKGSELAPPKWEV